MDNLIYFKFGDDVMRSKISTATFSVFLRDGQSNSGRGQQQETQIFIYRLYKNHNNGKLAKDMLHKKNIRLDTIDTGTW